MRISIKHHLDLDHGNTMKKIYIQKKETGASSQVVLLTVLAFVFGCISTSIIALNIKVSSVESTPHQGLGLPLATVPLFSEPSGRDLKTPALPATASEAAAAAGTTKQQGNLNEHAYAVNTILRGQRILVAIAAYDFSQLPHLEEVITAYHDVCIAGASVDVVIHATVAYPVTLIDLWNSRFVCPDMNISIVLVNKSLRLHLADVHRTLFYEKINEYDLFIYTEDDIRVTPGTVATYLFETRRVADLVAADPALKPSDFNVGIVRYEYNYPANVVIDDKTRHATQNVTRVYWEHSGFTRPVVPNAVEGITVKPLEEDYMTMKNHHQGMFLATRELLEAWKVRPKCQFDVIRDRPGRGSQPSEGTQRVWMSSQMLYGGRHCGVKQVIPMEKFGALTVLHLPNKNYRRVGKYRKREFSDGTETFEAPSDKLLSAMELHIALRQAWPSKPQRPYQGIRMIDEVTKPGDRTPLLERRLDEYNAYAKRGGVLTEYDMTRIVTMEDS
jgi:hypothetical protein